MASLTPSWAAKFIGKTISPDAVDIVTSEGAGIASTRGVYWLRFESVSACKDYPAEIELRLKSKDRVIKQIDSKVFVVYYAPPIVEEQAVKVPLKSKDSVFAQRLLRKITKG